MQGIVSINITTSGNVLLNKNGVPILFYCNSSDEVKDSILGNTAFLEYLNNNIFTIKNYSDARISYSFYNNVDGEDIYESNSIEIEDWKPLNELHILCNSFLKTVISEISTQILSTPVDWTNNFENDVINIYSSIELIYGDKFSKLTYQNFILNELKRFDLKEHNYKYLTNYISKIINV